MLPIWVNEFLARVERRVQARVDARVGSIAADCWVQLEG